MYAGGEGDDVRRTAGSALMRLGGGDICRILEVCSEVSGGESLRFLLGDVVKVKGPYSLMEIRLGKRKVLRSENEGRLIP